ncbi:hypothetical protein GOBAR_AA03428 [Gossypium barbadense]|uniref:Uncharacterized protein n=1 Tax=Gossypium barbadense TaxID=3634 RepID=A0A2P5YNI1_GOSBA|nr:hypothetical protein GOBAR_AA03428 [Gossypium barbadense]
MLGMRTTRDKIPLGLGRAKTEPTNSTYAPQQLRIQARPSQGQGADGSLTWEAQGVPNMTGENGQAKLEPIAMHKPPQEIFARIGNLEAFDCLKWGHSSLARTSQAPRCRWVPEAPAHPSTKLPMVSEAPAPPSHRGSRTSEPPRCRWCPRLPHDQGPMVAEAPARPRAYFTDGARASRTTKGLGCRWCPRFRHIQAPRCRWCSRLPHDQGPSLPMVVDGARGSRTSKHQGADGARGSRTTKGIGCRQCPRLPPIIAPRCRWWPRLPHDQGPSLPMVSEAPARPRAYFADGGRGSRTTKGLVCRWCPSLSHDQGPRLPMVREVLAHPSTKHRGADGARGYRTTKGLGCRWCPRLPHIEAPRCRWRPRLLQYQGLSLPMVSGAPAHPSTRLPMVPEAPARPRAYATGTVHRSTDGTVRRSTAGTDRRSTTGNLTGGGGAPTSGHTAPAHPSTKVPMVLEAPAHHSTEVPMVSEAPHNQGPSLPVVSDAPAHPCTKVPMVLEAPAHPSIKPNASAPTGAEVVDGARGSRTSEAPSKATLPLTIPRRVFKSSAKDSTRRSVGITLQGGARDLSAAAAAPTTRALGGQRPLLRVGNRATGACVASSPDSDLEAFSHNPAHGSFAPLAFQPSAMTNCANQRFLSY